MIHALIQDVEYRHNVNRMILLNVKTRRVTFSWYGFLLAYLSLFASDVSLSSSLLSQKACLDRLAQYALTDDQFRAAESTSFWFGFKNEGSPLIEAPKETDIDLDSDEVFTWSPIQPEQIRSFNRYEGELISVQPRITEYERRVILLRSGDHVHFGKHSFSLGEFLGAGNKKHVYALADQTDQVLLIPFLSQSRVLYWDEYDPRKRVASSKRSLINLAIPPSKVDGLHIIKTTMEGVVDPDQLPAHALATRVRGNENGRTWVKTIFDLDIEELDEALSRLGSVTNPSDLMQSMKSFLSKASAHKEKLEKLMYTYALYRSANSSRSFHDLRQFVWDTELEEWILVDWD